MGQATSCATLFMSIDAGLSQQERKRHGRQELDTAVRQLLDSLTQYQMPATWALSDPASPLSYRILSRNSQHEIAALGDDSWIGYHVGRRQFAHELQRRVERARQVDIALSTIALHDVTLSANLDLVVKFGIDVLRLAHTASRPTAPLPRTQLHRYGIWQTAATVELPVSSKRWFSQHSLFRSALKRALLNRHAVHLRIDVARMLDTAKPTLHVLRNMLRSAQQHRLTGSLDVTTLKRAAADLQTRPATTPSQSILRRVG